MSQHNADVMVHINEDLDEVGLQDLEQEISDNIGVLRVAHNPRHPHLVVVDFDAEVTRPASILSQVRDQGMHAQLIGF